MPAGVLNPAPEIGAVPVPPRLAAPLKKSFWPITVSASGGVRLFSADAPNRRMRLFPVSATQRFPPGSNASIRGAFINNLVVPAVRVVNPGWP